MFTESGKSNIRILLLLLPIQTACVSHQHQPDPATLTDSANCEIVDGSYIVFSVEDGRVLAESLFDEDDVVSAIAIEKTANQIAVRANTVNRQTPLTAFFNRFTCNDSVLKLILSDQYSADGVFMNASARVLELFVSYDSSLNLRFTNTTLAFFFIIPYYSSSDKLVTLQKQPTDLK